jgi:hypothetical protein
MSTSAPPIAVVGAVPDHPVRFDVYPPFSLR